MNVREPPQPPAVGAVSTDWGVMLHELNPRHVVLTTLPLPGSVPTHVPAAKGPLVAQAPVGLP